MNCQDIATALSKLKVDKLSRIRNKYKVTDELHSMHLKAIDNSLMDVRLFVSRLSTGHSSKELLKMIDEFIYNQQVK